MASGWEGESKRHSIAKKYGSTGSKKVRISKMSSWAKYPGVARIVSRTSRDTRTLINDMIALNDKRLDVIQKARDAIDKNEEDGKKKDNALLVLFNMDESQEDDVRELILSDDRKHDDDEEEDEGYENGNDEE